jgi:hypothetical protein
MSSITQGYPQPGSGQVPVAGRAKQDVAQTSEKVKQYGSNLAEEAKEQATQAKAVVTEKVCEATESVKASGRQYFIRKKEQATEELCVFRDAIREAADKLRQENHPEIASYVAAAAEQCDRMRDVLEHRGIGELAEDAKRFTRRHPEMVYGGLFFAGLAMMRFLKASGRHESDVQMNRPRLSPSGPSPYSATSQWPAGSMQEGRLQNRDTAGKQSSESQHMSERTEQSSFSGLGACAPSPASTSSDSPGSSSPSGPSTPSGQSVTNPLRENS